MEIHYLRPPDRLQLFRQRMIHDGPEVKITLARGLDFDPPLEIDGEVALESGSDALWFTFPGQWHDIGHFHRADGRYTGTYANILTPPEIHPDGRWYTTDLFLDLWIDPEGELHLLDEDQFEAAISEGWIDTAQAEGARTEVARLTSGHASGTWPPKEVWAWDRDRAVRLSSRS